MLLNMSKHFLVFIVVVLFYNTLFAQKEQNVFWRKPVGENAIKEVSYNYILVKGDTILNNKYEVLLLDYNPDSVSRVQKLILNYLNGRIEGDFYLESTNFITKNDFPGYSDFKILQSIKGRAIYSSGNYKQGVRNGKWHQYEVDIDDRNQDTISAVSVRFDNRGRWNGTLLYSETKFNFIGDFKENYPNGIWEGKANGIEFEYVFDDGVLHSIHVGNNKLDLIRDASITEFIEYPIDDLFVSYISKNKLGNEKSDSVSKLVSQHIVQIVSHFTPSKELVSKFHDASGFDQPKIRLPLFPFTGEDSKILSQTLSLYEILAPKIDSILIQPDLVLSCHDDNEIAQSMAVFKLIQLRLAVMSNLLQASKTKIGKHLNWDLLSKEVVRRLNHIYEKKYECLNENYVYTSERIKYDENQSSFENLFSQINYLDSLYRVYSKTIDRQLETVRIGEELDGLQREFTKVSLEIDSLIEEIYIPTEYRAEYKVGFRNFQDLLITRFKESIVKDDIESTKLLIKEIIQLRFLLEQTSIWVKTHQVIGDKYRYLYLDPNTFEERVELLYEQIFRTYERKLMPFIINQLSFNFNNIDEFTKTFENIDKLQKRMLAVLDENPRKLNRKMKSRDSVEKALEKLELILN